MTKVNVRRGASRWEINRKGMHLLFKYTSMISSYRWRYRYGTPRGQDILVSSRCIRQVSTWNNCLKFFMCNLYVILFVFFFGVVRDGMLSIDLWYISQAKPDWWLVSLGSGSGNGLIHQATNHNMLVKFHHTIWRHQGPMVNDVKHISVLDFHIHVVVSARYRRR